MQRKGNRLYKFEKLRSAIAIGRLYDRSSDGVGDGAASPRACLAFPIRAVWRLNEGRAIDCPQFLITIPKKRIRHAVDRLTMRRRVREAYRLNRMLLPADARLDIAFGYVGNTLTDYARVERAMQKILSRIASELADPQPSQDEKTDN